MNGALTSVVIELLSSDFICVFVLLKLQPHLDS